MPKPSLVPGVKLSFFPPFIANALANRTTAADGDEQPTARAVSERLVRLRAMFKAKGNGNGNMKVRFNNSTTPTGTPKKPKVSPNKNGKGGNGGVGGKRKRLPDE